MSPRLMSIISESCLWCLLALSANPGILAVTLRPTAAPAKGPGTVTAQAKFFQDFFSVQLSPYKLEFGHVCEDPNTWEQRYEHKDLKNFRDMGKVRWGDKHGGYGEHYWDLNHAGSSPNHATADNNDDQNHQFDHDYKFDANDPYDATVETGEYNPNYGDDEYDAEKSAQSDSSLENNRAKREHVRIKAEKRLYRSTEDDDDEEEEEPKRQTRSKESDEDEINRELDEALTQDVHKTNARKIRKSKRQHQHKPAIKELNLEEDPEEEEVTVKPKIRKNQDSSDVADTSDEIKNKDQEKSPRSSYDTTRKLNDNNHHLRQGRTVFNPYRADVQRINENYGARNLQNHYVPFEGDAGFRQHQADASVAASTPFRLFLEPSTGHVIDRATGLAYVLQPLAPANNFDTYN